MTSRNELLRFARAHEGEHTLSVYVAAAPADPSDSQTWMLRLRNQVSAIRDALAESSADERKAFERCVSKVFEQLPAEGAMPRDRSSAYFCAASDREPLAIALPPGVETSASWGIGARVVPYLRVAEPEEAMLVQVDRERARLSRYAEGKFSQTAALQAGQVDEVSPHMSLPSSAGLHRQTLQTAHRSGEIASGFHSATRGEAGADEEQRIQRVESERLHAAVVRRLESEAQQPMPIVIGGAPDAAAQVLDALPTSLRPHAVLTEDLRMDPPDRHRDAVRHAFRDLRTRRQKERIATLRELAHRGGRAATGYGEAERALRLGAVSELIFSSDAWRAHPEKMETLVQRALAHGAEVAVVEPVASTLLDGDADGIIAGLRFPLDAAS